MKKLIYKLRWFVKNQWGDPLAQRQILAILAKLLGEKPPAPTSNPPPTSTRTKSSGKVEMYLPICKIIGPKARTRGNYPKGYPEGAIVHWTGGHWDQSGEAAMAFQKKSGMCYFYIDQHGTIFQNFPLNRWGYHAGKSKWPGWGSSVSNRAVGIEVACAGTLNSKNQPSFKRTVPSDQVRVVGNKDNMQAGRYQKYTPEQEQALTKLILALKENNPDVFDLNLVLGHDEVSGKRGIGWNRKSDPGGSLSMTMDEYRAKLNKLYNQPTTT